MAHRIHETDERSHFQAMLHEANTYTFEQFKEAAAQLESADKMYMLARRTSFPDKASAHVLTVDNQMAPTGRFGY